MRPGAAGARGAGAVGPRAPTDLTAAPERSAVLVSWRAPATGSPVGKYPVTADPGSASCETTGLSCVLRGLVGSTYSFTVTSFGANDVAGTPARVRTSAAVAAPETPLTLLTERGLITNAAPG